MTNKSATAKFRINILVTVLIRGRHETTKITREFPINPKTKMNRYAKMRVKVNPAEYFWQLKFFTNKSESWKEDSSDDELLLINIQDQESFSEFWEWDAASNSKDMIVFLSTQDRMKMMSPPIKLYWEDWCWWRRKFICCCVAEKVS